MECPKCGYPHAAPPKCRACGAEIKEAEEPGKIELAELTKEGKLEVRVSELVENNNRRALEALARDVGLEPTKTKYPNKKSLARAIAEKEFPAEEK